MKKLHIITIQLLFILSILSIFVLDVNAQDNLGIIPEKYDGRDYGYLTPVRDQKGSNMCWAYATLACLEADAVKNNGFSQDLDLSEYHLGYFTFFDKKDPLGLTNSDTVFFHNPSTENNFIARGGNLNYAVSTFTNGVGPVLESVVPTSKIFKENGVVYDDAYTWEIEEAFRRGKNILEIDNVYVYSLMMKQNNDLIKKGIMEHGAAAATYYCQQTNLYNTTDQYGTAYYQDDNVSDPDHGIAIVGWDDNYPVSAFKEGHRPEHPGAWLVKNSWGNAEHFTTDGYFWLSYDDASFTHTTSENRTPEAYIYDVRPAGKYKYIYQYDGGIVHENSLSLTEQKATKYANIFTAQSDGKMEAIGIQTDRGYANAPCVLEIYTDVTNVPDQGNLIYQESFTVPGNGYFTIPLSKSLQIKKEQTFSVVIKQDSDWQCAYICTDRTYDPQNSAYASTNNTLENQSFIYDGQEHQWKDLHYENFYVYENGTSLCIKAFLNEQISNGGGVDNGNYSNSDVGNDAIDENDESVDEEKTINPPVTNIHSIKAKRKSFVVKWTKKNTNVTGYIIQYSTSKKFNRGNKTVTIKSKSITSKTIKGLKAKKKYYVRICTYINDNGKKIPSNWSAMKLIRTK